MAHRRGKEPINTNPFPADRSTRKSFTTVVDEATLKKMNLPPDFLNDHSHELTCFANLIDPNGCMWRMGLIRSQNSIAFNKKWDNFVEHYSIKKRYRLLVDYEGSSTFLVRIFGRDAFEIKYPSRSEEPSGEESEDEHTILLSSEEEDEHSDDEEYEESNESDSNGGSGEMQTFDSDYSLYLSRTGVINPRAISAATDFRTRSRHPNFQIVLKKYSILYHAVNIPRSFSKVYFEGRPNYSVQLKLKYFSDGRNWVVNVNHQDRFGGGWKAFVEENNLKVEDVCVFELLEDYVMEVSIFRA